jgi:hypothetical protein
VLGQQQVTEKGNEYWFCQFAFTEQDGMQQIDGKEQKTAEPLMKLRRHNRLSDGKIDDLTMTFGISKSFPAELRIPRILVIDVSPDVVTAYWEDPRFPFATVSRAPMLIEGVNSITEQGSFKNPNPPLPAMRGSLGLICERGTAICEEAVLEPLPD